MTRDDTFIAAGRDADELIAREVDRQDIMWGASNERADTTKGQLMHAGMAQLNALHSRQVGVAAAFEKAPHPYPTDWSGFRDYGSDIANLVVAAAFLRQEIKRRLANGEPTTRLSRNPSTQPYTGITPTGIGS